MSQISGRSAQTNIRFTKANIDGLTLNTAYALATTKAGAQNFYPIRVTASLTAVTGSPVGAVSVSIGTDGSQLNIMPSTALAALTAAGTMGIPALSGIVTAVPPSTAISIKVTGVVTVATVYTLKVSLEGYYE